MHYSRIFLFSVFFSFFALNGKTQTDSVLRIFNNRSEKDTTRLKAITKFAYGLLSKNLDSAELLARKGLAFAKEKKQRKWEGRLNNAIGLSYFYRGAYPKALNYYFEALKIAEELNDKRNTAAMLNNIGGIYYFMLDYEKALKYYKKALTIAEPMKITYVMGNTYGNVASIYYDLPDSSAKKMGLTRIQKYREAINYNLKSLKIAEETNYQESVAITYGNLGSIYERLHDDECAAFDITPGKQYDKALEYHNKSLKLKLEIGDRQGLPTSYSNIAALYYRSKQYNKAIEMGNKGLEIATEIGGDMETEKVIREILYKTYKDMGQEAKAFQHYEKFVTLRDSMYKIDNHKEIVKRELDYEYQKKKDAMVADSLKRVEDKKTADAINKAKLREERTLLYAFIGLALFVILVVVLFLNQRRLKLKKKNLEEKETLLQKLNEQQSKLHQATLEGQENERKRIAAELHDGLGGALSTVKLKLDTYGKSLSENEREKLSPSLTMLDEVCDDLRTISHNMMPGSLVKLGIASAVKDFVLKINSTGTIKIHFETHGMDERLHESIEIALFRAIQEATNNILKHTEASKASIQLFRHDETLTVMIEDNGKGFDPSIKETSSGIGLKNIESRMNYLGGKVVFDSQPGKGTSVIIELPYKAA